MRELYAAISARYLSADRVPAEQECRRDSASADGRDTMLFIRILRHFNPEEAFSFRASGEGRMEGWMDGLMDGRKEGWKGRSKTHVSPCFSRREGGFPFHLSIMLGMCFFSAFRVAAKAWIRQLALRLVYIARRAGTSTTKKGRISISRSRPSFLLAVPRGAGSWLDGCSETPESAACFPVPDSPEMPGNPGPWAT